MKEEHIIWHANQMADQEKRYIKMFLADLNEIDKMPPFAIQSKIKKFKKKYLEWEGMFN